MQTIVLCSLVMLVLLTLLLMVSALWVSCVGVLRCPVGVNMVVGCLRCCTRTARSANTQTESEVLLISHDELIRRS